MAYGMKNMETPDPSSDQFYFLPPWVSIKPETILISDPHRGNHQLTRSWEPRDFISLQTFDGEVHQVSLQTCVKLIEWGYAFLSKRVGHD